MNDRNFKGVWIPKQIWECSSLTLQEKVFFTEIESLDNEEGCFASNGYFADFFGLSKTRVSLVIKSLIEKRYITSLIIYREGTKEILKRVLKVCYIGYVIEVKDPTQGKLKDNNTVNNTINNTINKSYKEYEIIINEFTNNEELRKSIKAFVDMRKTIKKKLTDDGLELILKKINKFAKNDNEKIEILNNSTMGSWQGVFPLKGDKNGGARQYNAASKEQSSTESEGDRLARRATEKYGTNLEDIKCDF